MLLTIEYQREIQELDIICDDAGIESLILALVELKDGGDGHAHLMTPSWAGDELTEARQTEGGDLINHLRIVLKRGSLAGASSTRVYPDSNGAGLPQVRRGREGS